MNGKKARQIRQAKAGDVTWVEGMGYVHTDAVEAASDRDRDYFAANPDREWYVRERMHLEFPDRVDPQYSAVCVRTWGEGVRERVPITQKQAQELAACQRAGIEVFFPEDELSTALAALAASRASKDEETRA